MTPERWQQVKRLLESALERDPKDRAALLDEACKSDPSLRREVESLIASHEQARSLFDSPPIEAAASLLADDRANLVGRRLGHFKILSELGRGGMGEVFLAQDNRLGRRVALKLLPSFYTRDQERLNRFELEARSASGLNHPNIVTIFDVGQIEGIHFIATEFVEGETLRSAMRRARMSLTEVLDICSQAAAALAAAHAAGIVHRDIKPENIMLRPDRYVKLLDFGLAKLTEPQTPTSETAPTMIKAQTDPGTVVGTACYMSPEQARALAVDARTDIFSLGVVLYEMLTHHLPFQGPTTSDVIAAILKTEPNPLRQYVADVPTELQRIVSKALRKDREERYQSVRDLMVDLRSLKQELELEARLRAPAHSLTEGARTPITGGGQVPLRTGGGLDVETADAAAPTTTSSAEIIITEIKRHKTGAAIALLMLILLIGGIGYGLYRLIRQDKTASPFQTMKIARLTSTGRAVEAAISPDGKYLVYVADDPAGQSIWIRHVATSSNVQIVPPAEADYGGVIFSPDGNYVYYVKQETGAPADALCLVPVLGGTPKKLTERIHGSITFSPDGKQIAFARWRPGRGDGARGEKLLTVMNADGSGERKLTSRWAPEVFVDSAWSPNGKVIACTVANVSDRDVRLVEVQAEDGTERQIAAQKWFNVGPIAWLPDGSGLIVPGSDKPASPPQIWHVSYPGGEARRITNDLNAYNGVSLTADAKALVTVQSDQASNIWIAGGGDASLAKRITSGVGKHGVGVFADPQGGSRSDAGGGVCWTADGKIVYHSIAGGKLDIWIMNGDGTGQKQLTSDAGSSFYPSVSADGRYIVFQSDRAGNGNVWRMDSDGGNPKQLTTDGGVFPNCSPDGKWVVYTVTTSGKNSIWKVPIDGGAPAPFPLNDLNDTATRPFFSPDGRLVALNYLPVGSDWQLRIAAMSFETAQPAKVFPIMTIDPMREIRWTADGLGLTYIETRQGVSNLWSQPLDGGKPVQLTDFKSDLIFSWDWSRDGRLACARGTQTSDVVLISDFR